MARDCKCLHGKLRDSLHDGKNTILGKEFPGGNLLIVSAITPTDLAQHTIRYLLCDEPDKYPTSVRSASGEDEGDPMDLAWKRALTFGSRRKRVMACSPTAEGRSRIGAAYESSDQRRPYVPCPYCGFFQVLAFSQVKGANGGSFAPDPANARIECVNPKCLARWTELERWDAVQKTEWRATKPFNKIAGFWINHLYLPYTWKRTGDLAKEFLANKDRPNSLKVFINTALAELWQDKGERPDHERLQRRCESYPHTDSAVIPRRGLFLTAGVDVQESPPRLEVGVTAWGRDLECWSIGYWVLQAFADNGQPLPATSPELWTQLSQLLSRDFPHESGVTLPIWAMGVDTGSLPKPVYNFCMRHPRPTFTPGGNLRVTASRTVVATKGGDSDYKILEAVSKEDAARQRQHIRILTIGTHCAKREIYALLRDVEPKRDLRGNVDASAAVPGLYHFPMYDVDYFKQLTSEVRIEKANGDVVWEKRGRNEVLDCSVLNRAMASLVGIDRSNFPWSQLESAVASVLPSDSHSDLPVIADGAGATGLKPPSPPGSTPSAPPVVTSKPPSIPPPPPPVVPLTPAQLARLEWERSVGQEAEQRGYPRNANAQGGGPARPIRGRFL
jgi:phage terminase large subunit GpA-like protein